MDKRMVADRKSKERAKKQLEDNPVIMSDGRRLDELTTDEQASYYGLSQGGWD